MDTWQNEKNKPNFSQNKANSNPNKPNFKLAFFALFYLLKPILTHGIRYSNLNYAASCGKKSRMQKRIINKIIIYLGLVLLTACPAYADLAGRINKIIQNKSYTKVRFAIHVVDAGTGITAYAHNPRQKMTPASNMKIITSAAALNYLGPDYKYQTQLGLIGDDLVVIGSGDPLLGDETTDKKHGRSRNWIFEDIIEALKEKGVKSIDDIIIDRTFFDNNRVHPSWPRKQLNNPYAAEVSGLNYNKNCVRLTTTRNGSKVSISIDPSTKYIKLINQVQTITKGNSAVGAYRNTVPNKLTVRGKCNKSAGFDVAIENPAAFFGFLLGEKLTKAGIKVKGSLVEKYVKDTKKIRILRTYTTEFEDIMERCNKNSLNLAAEALVKTISAENTQGKINGEWKHGRKLIAAYLNKIGIDQSQFHLDDGSGLSRLNKLSPRALTKVLLTVYGSKNWQFYKDSLAVGGRDGTISRYFKDAKYAGKIRGKTGYISGVRAFSGVCQTSKGDYIFSILTEGGNSNVRGAINDIAKAIIDNAE
jgi:D-alanyl-D-alanine carboxypeptidase/D-alanyl-D-alanine-endopeptidase (penicillin-binding protein 4)